MLLAGLLIAASLIVFLWGAGGISYGDSARSTPLKVTANAQSYSTFGAPNSALVGDDGAKVFVSVTGETTPCPGKPSPPPTTSTTGVQVFTSRE